MTALTAKLERWAAWMPGVETDEQWSLWASGELKPLQDNREPSVTFLPAMFRRRLTRLSKMALSVAYQCLTEAEPVHTVFCSRHGDFNMTRHLLDEIIQNELISPTAFSMSVHNTASGLYTIARKDTSPSTALASGEDSFESGFLEAAALLQTQRAQRVLLVVCDEAVPELFSETYEGPMCAHAGAFLLSNKADEKRTLSLAIQASEAGSERDVQEPHMLSLLRCLIQQNQQLALSSHRVAWSWNLKY